MIGLLCWIFRRELSFWSPPSASILHFIAFNHQQTFIENPQRAGHTQGSPRQPRVTDVRLTMTYTRTEEGYLALTFGKPSYKRWCLKWVERKVGTCSAKPEGHSVEQGNRLQEVTSPLWALVSCAEEPTWPLTEMIHARCLAQSLTYSRYWKKPIPSFSVSRSLPLHILFFSLVPGDIVTVGLGCQFQDSQNNLKNRSYFPP